MDLWIQTATWVDCGPTYDQRSNNNDPLACGVFGDENDVRVKYVEAGSGLIADAQCLSDVGKPAGS